VYATNHQGHAIPSCVAECAAGWELMIARIAFDLKAGAEVSLSIQLRLSYSSKNSNISFSQLHPRKVNAWRSPLYPLSPSPYFSIINMQLNYAPMPLVNISRNHNRLELSLMKHSRPNLLHT
jgi:hypothetical protein